MRRARSALIRPAVIAVVLAIALGGGACGGSSNKGAIDASADRQGGCTAGGTAAGMIGQACGCDGDCQSGFCVDGVCCSTACTGTCRACNVQGSPGICAPVPAGGAPRSPNVCPASHASSCGLDGTCDGAGACRQHVAGTVCTPGTCVDAAVVDTNVCDGRGRCRAGPATICAPFNCDPAARACVTTCRSDLDCVGGVKCVNGSCGPKPPAALCSKDSDCASGFCTDGVCCNVACRGACTSCDQVGHVGTCWPVEVGGEDPRGQCKDKGPASCGQTGRCDGLGGCALYAPETICVAPSCSGDRLNTAGTCNGTGACRPPGVQACAPYRCSDGACIARCASDADCVTGQVCQNGSCGPKPNGQPCAAAGECASNFCVDGVCCAEACEGACRSCALPSSMGRCTPIADGAADLRNICVDRGPTTCGTDGKCDGSAGCRRYAPGTVCAPETCQNNVYTPPGTCSATGACIAANATACAPFACNGARCFVACTTDANCVFGQVCSGNSCGLKPNGAFCADGRECISGQCAQGVCCASACASACKSCALLSSMGICSNIPDGQPDPTGTCTDMGAESCGHNGRCQAGGCQSYTQGTPCRPATCPTNTTTFTPTGTCDGAGTCSYPVATSCFPFRCGIAACKSTCTSDADCAPPGVCSEGSCGLKPDGAVCGAGSECGSGVCAQGTCCRTACAGSCLSCALPGSAGICKPVAAGARDPAGLCRDQGAATCGSNGLCDGAGACQLYEAGTECAPPTCPAGTATATLTRACDGAGTCRPAIMQSCAPYTCNGTTCRAACTGDGDCIGGMVCNNGSCGKKRLGQICAAGSECDIGNCVDGVCCSSVSCGTCTSCNVTGSAGSCTPVPAGAMEPHGGCPAAPPCGWNGLCDGTGACRPTPAGTTCGAASCTGFMATPVGSCDGAGTCRQDPISCSPYQCGTNVCKATCVTDADCLGGFLCLGYSCTNLKPNGTACTAAAQCLSGNCTEGYCCGSAMCPSCRSCAVAGKQGTCSAIADGTVCGAAMCDGQDRYRPPSMCSSGNCMPATRVECVPFACEVASGCKNSCATNTDCARMHICALAVDGGANACVSSSPMP